MEDFKYKLSIIIPMYNAEKYIAGCLDSILNSDLQKGEYEVIIINDGSIDKGPQIAHEYCSKCDDFVYLSQENQGQSVARNYGIRTARGEYIWCVDCDDMVVPSLLPLFELVSNLNANIVAFRLKRVTESGDFISYVGLQTNVGHNKIISGRDAIIQGYLPSSVCALIIRKDLFQKNNLYFKEGITQQDVELSYQLMAFSDTVYFSDLEPYLYINHEDSTRQTKDFVRRVKYECDKIIIIKSFY